MNLDEKLILKNTRNSYVQMYECFQGDFFCLASEF